MADAAKGAAFLDRRPTVISPASLRADIHALWCDGLPGGDRTGWASIDRHYTVAPGMLTVITGWPGSGKSEWLDALLVHLARAGWRTAIFSPENRPLKLHVTKLLEKIAGMPFGHGPTERITAERIDQGVEEMSSWFGFVHTKDGDALTAKEVIAAATPWLEEHGGEKRGLVIDPWNELEHWRPRELSETEYVSQQLSLIRNWAREKNVHVWLVAHPAKMRREDGKLPVPTPDMISGSSHFWNKADCSITVWRDAKSGGQEVEIHVQKVRFKHIGRPGMVRLNYDRVTGRYHEPLSELSPAEKKRAARGEVDL